MDEYQRLDHVEPIRPTSLRSSAGASASSPMLSRVASSLYWMSRYLERAENAARLVDVNLNLILDSVQDDEQWRPLIMISGNVDAYLQKHTTFQRDSVIQYMTFDRDNPNSIAQCLANARENARTVREVISSEMWEQINLFYLTLRDPWARRVIQTEPHELFDRVKTGAATCLGVAESTMTHAEGYHFARLGRFLERADMVTRILDMKYFVLLPSPDDVGRPIDDIQWAALLRSISGMEMYRKRFGQIHPHRVVRFLMLDRQFPRSVLYCLEKALESLHRISGSTPGSFDNTAEQELGRIRADLAYTDAQQIIASGLHQYLDRLQGKLNAVDNAIFDTFFALRPVVGAVTRDSQ